MLPRGLVVRLATVAGVVVVVVGIVLVLVSANTLVHLARDPAARAGAFPNSLTVSRTGPNASFSWTSTNYNVTLTDTSTSNGSALVAWVWDFGDGTPIYSGPNPPTHTYAANCPMCVETVTLAVNDSKGGHSVATANVTVQARGNSQGVGTSPGVHLPSFGPLTSGLPEILELLVLMVVISYSTLRAGRELLRRPWAGVTVPVRSRSSPPR
jgi:PKD repeat protein